MQITDMLLTPNKYSRPQTKLSKVNGVAIHYVGNPGSTAVNNRNYFENLKNTGATYASSHYIVGLDGEIIRCIPENEIAYCTNARNEDTISIENCHPDASGKFNGKTYNSLIWLISDICTRYGLNPATDVIRHYDVTGKLCPLWYVNNPKDWERLKEDVKSTMSADECDPKKIKILINGVAKEVESVQKVDGKDGIINYVKLRDLESPEIAIGYDQTLDLPSVTTKPGGGKA